MAEPMKRWVEAMRTERFDEAWELAATALHALDPATRDDPALPYHQRWVWGGQPLDGRHVLVRCYHGLGDTLQFARFLAPLSARAASVTVEVQPRLVPVLAGFAGIDRLIPFDPARPTPRGQVDIEIMELAFALRTGPAAAAPPYLEASRAALPHGTIGLCYAAGDWDPERSVPGELLEPICRTHACLSLVAEVTELPVLNPGGCPFDVAATASLIASCELVITVDTMIAHLAGALGRPTWLLLKNVPDWRWNPRSERTCWYPTMRLFTQPEPGDWTPVLARVEGELSATTTSSVKEEANHDRPVLPVGTRLLG